MLKNEAHFFLSPCGNGLSINEQNEGMSLGDTTFAPSDSARPFKNKMALSPSSNGHGGPYNTQ